MDVRNTASARLAESLGASKVRFNKKVQFFKGFCSDECTAGVQPPAHSPEFLYEIIKHHPRLAEE